ncbi:H-type lectin domain-containing protein [Herpetosiphon gulosus]|uniref:H-type lectin domain-containing protein n=1 Tax=Herpetosiphon gulosus TaxID=1973496 RepID=A0ABP9WY53_9CHLR
MAYNHQDKQSGQLIRAADWNEMSREVARLDEAKVNRTGGDGIQGPLKVTAGADATQASLRVSATTNGPKAPLAEFRHSNQTQGVSIGYASILATGSNPNQPLAIAARGTDPLTLNAESGGNVGIGTTNPQNKLQVEGNLHLNGNALYLRKGAADQFHLLRWQETTDRVEIGGFQGVTLGHTKDGANVIKPVLQVRGDQQVEVSGSLTVQLDASTRNVPILQIRRSTAAREDGKFVFLELFQEYAAALGEVYPSIRFHHGNRYWRRIEGRSDGFHFKDGDINNDNLVGLVASSLRFGDGTTQSTAVRVQGGYVDIGAFRGNNQVSQVRRAISYAGFTEAPSVIVSIVAIDSERGNNLRFHGFAESVTRTGCTIVAQTWADTIIYGSWVSWIAIGR